MARVRKPASIFGVLDDLASDLDPLSNNGKLETVEVDVDPAQAE